MQSVLHDEDIEPVGGGETGPRLRAQVEQARYRRCAGLERDSFDPLDLPGERRTELRDALQVARAMRVPGEDGLQLHWDFSLTTLAPAIQRACAVGQAGDILTSMGALRRGSALLLEAANDGCIPALGALARWQLAAGHRELAWSTLYRLTETEAHWPELYASWRWLVQHHRPADALELARVIDRRRTPSSLTREGDPKSTPAGQVTAEFIDEPAFRSSLPQLHASTDQAWEELELRLLLLREQSLPDWGSSSD